MLLNVTDVNDNKPVVKLGSTNKVEIREDTKPGTKLFQATVTDKDSGANGKVGVTLLDVNTGAVSSEFEISALGAVTVKASLDRDKFDGTKQYTLRIVAKDQGKDQQLQSTQDLFVLVTDANDNAPFWNKDSSGEIINYDKTLAENAPKGNTVAKVLASVRRIYYI